MSRARLVRTVVAAGFLVLAAGCKKEPSRWDQAAASAKTAAAEAPSVAKTDGSKLNAFFPKDGEGGYSRVFTQEKTGFVEAQLKKDGALIATLAISDTTGDEAAKKKFDGASDKVGAAPLVTVGKNQSAALVGRYQVKVSSPTLDPAARKAILETFDLRGLTAL
jgi:hypothetical protein